MTGEQEALPWDADSSGALIYTAVNPDQLHQSSGARRSPWRFPFSHRREALTPIPEIHLCSGFRVRSSTFLVCAQRLTNAGWFHHLPHGSYHWLPQQGLVCDPVPAAHPCPKPRFPRGSELLPALGAAVPGAGGVKHRAGTLCWKAAPCQHTHGVITGQRC